VEGTPVPLPDEVEPHLLRIAQEALHNAARHSKGRNAWVRLAYGANEATLSVRDDGQGFDPQNTFDPRPAISDPGHAGAGRAHRRSLPSGQPAWRRDLVEVRVSIPGAAPGAGQAYSGAAKREA